MQALRAFLAHNRKPLLVYAAAGLLVMLPLFAQGFVLSVDLVFTPDITVSSVGSPDFLWWFVLKIISFVIPVVIIEKVILFAIVFLSGFGMYRWLRTVNNDGRSAYQMGAYLAGLLYAINPFCYSRFMAGQYLILLGYALLPFLATSVWRAAAHKRERWWRMLNPGVWLAIIATISLHIFGMAILLALSLAAALWLSGTLRGRLAIAFWAKNVGIFVLLSGFWIFTLLHGGSSAAHTISGFGQGDSQAFQTYAGSMSTAVNVLLMHGFWADAKNLYIAPENVYSWWWLPCLTVLVFTVLGYAQLYRRQSKLWKSMLVLGCVAFVLALGLSTGPIGHANQWIFNSVPLFKGYREPQKFVGLLLFVYCFGFASGFAWFYDRIKHVSSDLRTAFVIVVLAIIVLSAPLMPWALRGQLKTVNYPPDWAQVNTYFADKGKPNTVFLPWHLYMPYAFAGRLIANPAPKYFTNVHIIASMNPEIGKATGYNQTVLGNRVDAIVRHDTSQTPQLLYLLGVRYVIVAKDYDYHRYDALLSQTGFNVVKDLQTVRVYKVGVKE